MKKILIQLSSPVFANNAFFNDKDENNMLAPWREVKSRLANLGYDLVTADDNPVKDCSRIIFMDAVTLGERPPFAKRLKWQLKRLLGQKVDSFYPTRQLYKKRKEDGREKKKMFFFFVCSFF